MNRDKKKKNTKYDISKNNQKRGHWYGKPMMRSRHICRVAKNKEGLQERTRLILSRLNRTGKDSVSHQQRGLSNTKKEEITPSQ